MAGKEASAHGLCTAHVPWMMLMLTLTILHTLPRWWTTALPSA